MTFTFTHYFIHFIRNTGNHYHGSALAWQKNTVERALGSVEFFGHIDNPTFFGNVYSALVRMGGRKRRNDHKEVVAVIQAA